MKRLILILFVLASIAVKAQYFETGQDPASLKWRQINTENFQLIYPDYYEDQAQVLAQKLEMVYNVGSNSLNHNPSKISVILHTQTVKSNGLVAYAPKRSEFFTTPHQGIYPQDWLEQLALHEFRHVVQTDKLNSELPKIIKIILGEQGTALLFGGYLPWWFIEGDAVVTETALSNYGRGRFPSFLVEHRAQVVDNKRYSYDKAYLGSYKDYVPNHYRLGYFLVGNARDRYGAKIWENTLTTVGKKPFSLTPFNRSLKMQTGLNKVKLYESVFDSLATEWKDENQRFNEPLVKQLSPENKVYTNYIYNHWLNNDELISYKTALNRIPAFVKISPSGVEEKLTVPGFLFAESVSFQQEWITWAEQVPDVRWSHSGRSLIKIFNSKNKSTFSFYPEFKAYAPALSPNLNWLVLVETDFSNNNYLSVYEASTGEFKFRYKTIKNNFFFSPVWKNNDEIVCVILTENGKRLITVDLRSKSHQLLYKQELGDLKHLRIVNNTLYFISSYSGKNALYSFRFSDQVLTRLFNPRFDGAYPAISSNGVIALSDYTGNGFRLIKLNEISTIPVEEIEPGNWELANAMQEQEPGVIDFSTTDSIKYYSEPYSKPKSLLNFHSWAPVFVDPDSYQFLPGASLMSQNKLGTAFTTLGYKWDTSEKTGQFYGKYTYKGWFPVFDFEVTSGKRASQYWLISEYRKDGQVARRDTTLEKFKWNESTLNANMRIPFNLSKGAYFRAFQPEIKYELIHYGADSSTPDEFQEGFYSSLSYRMYYYQLLRKSHQDIYPNFGFTIDGSIRHSPWQSEKMGNLMAGSSNIYLPGIMANHGIRLYAGIQEKERGAMFRFSDAIRFPRGWGKIETENLNTYSFDYALPLINPDLSIGGLTYIRRISATFFADYGKLKGSYSSGETVSIFDIDLSSYGVELLGDVNFLRFYAPIKIGGRVSYLKEIEDFSFDFLISVDFNAL